METEIYFVTSLIHFSSIYASGRVYIGVKTYSLLEFLVRIN